MSKILVVGDAVVSTGFAKMNHAYVDGLRAAGYDVSMLGINYYGDPHPYPYDIYPCLTPAYRDPFGTQRLPDLVSKIRPDLISLTQDPWNVPLYLKRAGNTPMMASIAVDGKNCRGAMLNGLAYTVFWTRFGEAEAKRGGYTGPSSVIPLGVDVDTFKKEDRAEARRSLLGNSFPSDAFVVGVVGRNQPRKRIDLSMFYFAEWLASRKGVNAFLFLHVAPTGEDAYDLKQLAQYLGISSRIILSEPEAGAGSSIKHLVATYNSLDVMLSTAQGEGWGLCQMEAMACGVPCIVPDWSALGEWPEDAAIKVPCTSISCTINGINAVGGIMDRDMALEALDLVYDSADARATYGERGAALVRQPQFSWREIGAAYAAAAGATLGPRVMR